MVVGFIYARIGANHGGIIDARSPGCPQQVSTAAIEAAFSAVPDLADGDLKVEHIICDVSNTEASAGGVPLGPAVVCIRTHPAPVDTTAHISSPPASASSSPTVVITCLMSDSGVPNEVLRREASALNDFAGACINATSRSACEAVFAALLNPDDAAAVRRQSTLLSAASRSPSGLPRAVVERAVPVAFCFVPPQALGGATMGEANEFLDRNVPVVLQDRQKELHAAMPWNRDDGLTEHIVDTLRICSSFVADSMISDVLDLLECRQACELIPPHPSATEPTDPKHRSALAAALINADPSAQGAFFGRGVWFTGLFASDGAVVSATGGFFRLPMEEQVIVSTLVAQCNAPGDLSSSGNPPVQETHFFPDVIGQVQQQNTAASGHGFNNNNNKKAQQQQPVHATALPPMINVVETQVQFHPDTPNQAAFRASSNSNRSTTTTTMMMMPPVEGSIVTFVLDEHLRFVVGLPRHQGVTATMHGTSSSLSAVAGGAAQRTTSEVGMWAQQMLDNSLQVVSAREVAKYCSSQQSTEDGLFGFCMRCCGVAAAEGGPNAGVPSAGLRRISYLTPGLLRHYSVVIAAAATRAKKSCRYFSIGPDGSSPVRLLEAAAFSEHQPSQQQQQSSPLRSLPSNNASSNNTTTHNSTANVSDGSSKTSGSWSRPMLRYFVQVNRTASSSNNASSRYVLDDTSGGGGGAEGFFYETAAGRPSSLLNAHAWKDLLKFSELVLLDSVAPVNGLTLGMASRHGNGAACNFSVVSLASAVGTSAATTAEQYQQQTAKAVEAGKAVHASLQNIAYAALRSATTPSPFVIAAAAQANHAAPPNAASN